jgi:DNA-binding NarL/FixJ family response regulator
MDKDAPISLVVVDDHPLILSGITLLIESEPSFTLLGQASNGLEAIEQFQRHRPDVMLMDLNMPECGGVDAIRRIRAIDPTARIIILTTYEGEEDVYRGLMAGASAYLLKNSGFDQIVHCVRQVAANVKYLPPAIAAKLANRIGANQLSPRELEILVHLSAGKSNKVIARTAGIGVGTVKYHVNNILSKLNVTCRTEAASVALKRGLVHPF